MDIEGGARGIGAIRIPDGPGRPGTPGTPDALGRIVHADAMLGAYAADRLRNIERLHREAIAAAAAGPGMRHELVHRSVRLELAAALRITERGAAMLLDRADVLVNRYPAALAALASGAITEQHADLFTAAMERLTGHQRELHADRALERAEVLATGAYRRWLARLVETVTAPTLTERHEHALARRMVTVLSEDDGMGTLSVHGPLVEVHATYDRLTRMAKKLGAREDESRTRDQLRADALFDLLLDGEVTAHPEAVRGIRAEVVVTVPALSLLDDTEAVTAPATVQGVGPIPIDRARVLCGGAAGWMRVLTHPETGTVLSVGRTRYRPPASLARLVRWRSDRCLAPGCAMAANRCDIDHSVPWEEGGATAAWNLGPLCRGHHTMRHHGGWRITQLDGGVIEWISPLGRVYLVEPERRTPAFRPDPGSTDVPVLVDDAGSTAVDPPPF